MRSYLAFTYKFVLLDVVVIITPFQALLSGSQATRYIFYPDCSLSPARARHNILMLHKTESGCEAFHIFGCTARRPPVTVQQSLPCIPGRLQLEKFLLALMISSGDSGPRQGIHLHAVYCTATVVSGVADIPEDISSSGTSTT